jgi:hypothetical protein
MDQCDFGMNGVLRFFLESLLSHLQYKHLLGESGPERFWKFSRKEKLVAPLIAAPIVDRAIEDKMIGKKAMLQATHVFHACRKESLFFFANRLDKVLLEITLVV